MAAADPVPPLAVTMGEPAGIGPEIALNAWIRRQADDLPPFFVLADPTLLQTRATLFSPAPPIREIGHPRDAPAAFAEAVPVLPVSLPATVTPGAPSPDNAPAVVDAIRRAVALSRDGEAAGVVTCPIQKSTLYAAGFSHPGHTEFLAELCGIATAPVMLLTCPGLRTVPVTIHVPLRTAIDMLTTELIVDRATITARALTADYGIAAPRLAVAGLNPHAGEDGSLGSEDRDIIAPAVARLREAGIDVRGPMPPDTMFAPPIRAGFDVAICMYHDQALIPVKALDFDAGINVTLGLPIVRTSPDHGTALDLAGRGQANPNSLIASIREAGVIAAHRRSAG